MSETHKSIKLTSVVNDITFTAQCFSPTKHDQNCTLFCLPGGGASAEFFDLAPDYSFVQRMTEKGYTVITMDHPGTVTNPLPETHPFLKPRQSADYIAEALGNWVKHDTLIGVGHSMGGMMVSLVQARHNMFDALALFGSSAGGLEWGLSEGEKTYIDNPEAFSKDIEKLTLNKFKMAFPPSTGGPSGKSITFGGETPALTQRLRETSCELYAAGGMMSMTRGSFKQEIDALTLPLFFAFGDADIGIPPKDVPKDYINAKSIDVLVLENTGHNHFAFSSINTLCNALDHWLSTLD